MLCKYKSGEITVSSERHTNFRRIKPGKIHNFDVWAGIKQDFEAAKNELKRVYSQIRP